MSDSLQLRSQAPELKPVGAVVMIKVSRKLPRPMPFIELIDPSTSYGPQDFSPLLSTSGYVSRIAHLASKVAEEKYARHLLKVMGKFKRNGELSVDSRRVDVVFANVQVGAAFAHNAGRLDAIAAAASFTFRFDQQANFVGVARLALEACAFANLTAVVGALARFEE